MILTKAQRHTAYIIMLYYFEDENYHNGRFFCNVFETMTGIEVYYNDKAFKKILPELYKHRPKKNFIACVWFPTRQNIREKILKQCIEETYTAVK